MVDLASSVEAALIAVAARLHQRAALRREYGPMPFVAAEEGALVDTLTDLMRTTIEQLPPGGRENLVTIRLAAVPDGGRVEIITAGAKHHLTLPVAPGGQATAATGPRGRVLIVDDDQDVLRSTQRGLAFHHDVTALDDARHALKALAGGERYDAILCDLMMPDLSGQDLHAALAEVAPDVLPSIVFVTGGACTTEMHEFLTRVRSLEKPVTLARIRRIVADAVSGIAPGS
jgi:CheY-like chemotaxis protein